MIKNLDFNKAKTLTEECMVMSEKIDEIINIVNLLTMPSMPNVLIDGNLVSGDINLKAIVRNLEVVKANVDDLDINKQAINKY